MQYFLHIIIPLGHLNIGDMMVKLTCMKYIMFTLTIHAADK